MGLIIKDKIIYGGGDNSVEISYADYLALSDEERNNGTTYYITDVDPVSVGDESNMKYDPETDMKYLKNQDGEWVQVGYGGLLTNYLYHLGDDFADKTGGYESLAVTHLSNRVSAAKTPILSMESNHMYITWSGSISYSNGAVFNKTPIDITDINKLSVTLSASGTTNSAVQFIITSNNKSLLNILSSTDIRNGKTSANDTFEIDVSSISGVVYYGVYFTTSDGGTVTNEVSISSIWLE